MNITLNINDTYCTKCCKSSSEKTETFTSSSQSIELQDNYFFNVINVSASRFSIIIQNGECVIIRNIIIGVPTSISLPSKCTHIVTITSV